MGEEDGGGKQNPLVVLTDKEWVFIHWEVWLHYYSETKQFPEQLEWTEGSGSVQRDMWLCVSELAMLVIIFSFVIVVQ